MYSDKISADILTAHVPRRTQQMAFVQDQADVYIAGWHTWSCTRKAAAWYPSKLTVGINLQMQPLPVAMVRSFLHDVIALHHYNQAEPDDP